MAEIIEGQGHKLEKPKKVDNTSVAKLFEEVKVMYQDLPGRIESRLSEYPLRSSQWPSLNKHTTSTIVASTATSALSLHFNCGTLVTMP